MTPKSVSSSRLRYSWYFPQIWCNFDLSFKSCQPTSIVISSCLNRHNYAAMMGFFQSMLFFCFFVMVLIIWYQKSRKMLFLGKLCLIPPMNPPHVKAFNYGHSFFWRKLLTSALELDSFINLCARIILIGYLLSMTH